MIVRDRSGTPLRDVRVTSPDPPARILVTDAAGTASLGTLRDGSYRLRFERDGFITLERDISIRSGATLDDRGGAQLRRRRHRPPLRAPAARASGPAAAGCRHGSGTAAVVSTQWATGVRLDSGLPRQELHRPRHRSRNRSWRASRIRPPGCCNCTRPLASTRTPTWTKCSTSSRARAPSAARGESSTVSSRGAAGALSIIPHGVPHAIERRGRNPLMVRRCCRARRVPPIRTGGAREPLDISQASVRFLQLGFRNWGLDSGVWGLGSGKPDRSSRLQPPAPSLQPAIGT